jgi:hypothetical protein
MAQAEAVLNDLYLLVETMFPVDEMLLSPQAGVVQAISYVLHPAVSSLSLVDISIAPTSQTRRCRRAVAVQATFDRPLANLPTFRPYYRIKLQLITSVKCYRGMLTLVRKWSYQDAEGLETYLAHALVPRALPCTPLAEVELAIFSMALATRIRLTFWIARSV